MVASTGGFGIESLLRGVVGIITVLAVSYLMSSNRKKIDWKLVGSGLLIQFVLAYPFFMYLL
jgi:Nucleoside permease